MANPHRGEVAFKVGEDEYKFRFSTNAICEAEALLGMGFQTIVKHMDRVMYLRALLWAGLQAKHPNVSLRNAGDLIDLAGSDAVTIMLIEALAAAFPKEDGDDAKNA